MIFPIMRMVAIRGKWGFWWDSVTCSIWNEQQTIQLQVFFLQWSFNPLYWPKHPGEPSTDVFLNDYNDDADVDLSLVGRVRLGNHLTNPVPTKTHRCSVSLWFSTFFYISIFLWWWWWYGWWLCCHENVNNNDGDDDVSIAWSAMCIFWSGKKSSAKSHKR